MVQDDGLVGWAGCSGSVSSENKSTKFLARASERKTEC